MSPFQRQGCIHGEELPYVFGAPLVGGFMHFGRNYTKSEIVLSETTMIYWSNFARTGWVGCFGCFRISQLVVALSFVLLTATLTSFLMRTWPTERGPKGAGLKISNGLPMRRFTKSIWIWVSRLLFSEPLKSEVTGCNQYYLRYFQNYFCCN